MLLNAQHCHEIHVYDDFHVHVCKLLTTVYLYDYMLSLKYINSRYKTKKDVSFVAEWLYKMHNDFKDLVHMF